MRRIAVIINPASGCRRRFKQANTCDGRASLVQSWFDQSQVTSEIAVFETRLPGRGAEQATVALSQGFDTIVAAGGDGTVREVIDGMCAARTAAALGILPLGTVNVLARSLNIPLNDPSAAARIVQHGRRADLDFAHCNGSAFVLHCGIGLDAEIVHGVSTRLKRFIGRYAYLLKATGCILSLKRHSLEIVIDSSSDPIQVADVYQLFVANVGEYAGSLCLSPSIDPQDGELDIVICHSTGGTAPWKWKALRDAVQLCRGNLTAQIGVQTYRAKSVTIRSLSNSRIPVQLDGDSAGDLPVNITIATRPLTVMTPE